MIASGSLDGTWDSKSPRYQREARSIYISRVFLIQAVCMGSHLLRNRWYFLCAADPGSEDEGLYPWRIPAKTLRDGVKVTRALSPTGGQSHHFVP